MAATIGIKIANGDFYSILQESSSVKKRLVLTTVHDNQKSVQIDLYKSVAKTMADAVYIGSLVVENIKDRPKGEPSIEMIISSNAEGEITADAVDLDAPEGSDLHHLSVSLQSLDDDSRDYNIPDFELDSNEAPPQGLYEHASKINEANAKKKVPVLWIIILILVLLFIGALIYVLLGGEKSDKTDTPAPSATEKPVVQPEPIQPKPQTPPPPLPPKDVPIIAAPPVQPKPPAEPARTATPPRARPETSADSRYTVPDTIPKDGVAYKIRWGDTLWDISEAYYRNPWLYPRIARFNGIRNPDRIISGNTIRIPPKN
jgi:hypothetical protein